MADDTPVWLVTGCSRGLGRDIAEAVIAAGARIAVTARRQPDVADLAAGRDDQVLALALDVTDPGQCAAAVAATVGRFGRLDVLVNNAGYAQLGAVEEIEEEEARAQFETNFFGAVRLIQASLPVMREARAGRIVNISSVGGFAALAGCGQYAATKFALEGLSEALAIEVAPLGIRVIVVEPNGFRTDFVKQQSMRRSDARIADCEATSGAVLARLAASDGRQPSDPKRGAKAIVEAVTSDDPPFRLVLGTSGVTRVRDKLAVVEAELARWAALSDSVSFPDPSEQRA